MINQLILVGRIGKIIKGNDNTVVVLNIPKPYKNENGEYDIDMIKVELNNMLGANVKEYCEVGDILAIKGKLGSVNDIIKVEAEKVTFLSSNRNNN